LQFRGARFSSPEVSAAAGYNGIRRTVAENPMPIEKNQVVLFHYSVTVTPEKAYGQRKATRMGRVGIIEG
tara:strand:- start:4262 stop:4471 length:210 start_codon:yes stop_codon:yes gene_type:complete